MPITERQAADAVAAAFKEKFKETTKKLVETVVSADGIITIENSASTATAKLLNALADKVFEHFNKAKVRANLLDRRTPAEYLLEQDRAKILEGIVAQYIQVNQGRARTTVPIGKGKLLEEDDESGTRSPPPPIPTPTPLDPPPGNPASTTKPALPPNKPPVARRPEPTPPTASAATPTPTPRPVPPRPGANKLTPPGPETTKRTQEDLEPSGPATKKQDVPATAPAVTPRLPPAVPVRPAATTGPAPAAPAVTSRPVPAVPPRPLSQPFVKPMSPAAAATTSQEPQKRPPLPFGAADLANAKLGNRAAKPVSSASTKPSSEKPSFLGDIAQGGFSLKKVGEAAKKQGTKQATMGDKAEGMIGQVRQRKNSSEEDDEGWDEDTKKPPSSPRKQ